ncbi:MAG: hypothetical protein ACN4GT_08005 [Gammaproteobacteria bacterium]
MKKLSIGVCAIVAAANPGSVQAADVSITANRGAVTQSIFRGVPQTGLDLFSN